MFYPLSAFPFGPLFFQPLQIGSNYSLQALQTSSVALRVHSVTSSLK